MYLNFSIVLSLICKCILTNSRIYGPVNEWMCKPCVCQCMPDTSIYWKSTLCVGHLRVHFTDSQIHPPVAAIGCMGWLFFKIILISYKAWLSLLNDIITFGKLEKVKVQVINNKLKIKSMAFC